MVCSGAGLRFFEEIFSIARIGLGIKKLLRSRGYELLYTPSVRSRQRAEFDRLPQATASDGQKSAVRHRTVPCVQAVCEHMPLIKIRRKIHLSSVFSETLSD
jgi:hypothetical protein